MAMPMRFHTNEMASLEIRLPKMAVNPQMKTTMCNLIWLFLTLFGCNSVEVYSDNSKNNVRYPNGHQRWHAVCIGKGVRNLA